MRRRKKAGAASWTFPFLLASMFVFPPVANAETDFTNEKQLHVVAYTVKQGDSLSQLSETYHTSIQLLRELNHVSDNAILQIGQKLNLIPYCKSIQVTEYDVKPGDTIWNIAQNFHTTLDHIVPQGENEFAGILQPGTKVYALQDSLQDLKNNAIPTTATPIDFLPSQGPPLVYAKTLVCKLTAYGPGYQSTGKNPGDPGYGITASGRVARENQTIAVDPNVIPMGSLVYIDGLGYRKAEDTGGAIKGNRIDVFFTDDNKALQFGVKDSVRVFLVK